MSKLKTWLIPLWIACVLAIVAIGYKLEPNDPNAMNQKDVNILQKLASNGEYKAQLMLGLAYINGEYGLEPDKDKGIEYLKQAADNGNEYAKNLLTKDHLSVPVTVPNGATSQKPNVIQLVWGNHRDLILFVASLILLIGYHIELYRRSKADPTHTIHAINSAARDSWVRTMMGEHNGILAVQTLRNSTMASTFLASTAILLIIGMSNVMHFGTQAGNTDHAVSLIHAFKVAPLLLSLFTAFFMFTLSIRMLNHVGYLINCNNPEITVDFVADTLNKGGWYYTIGMRGYYLSIPFICWLFNPLLMFIASSVLLFVLHHVDEAKQA